MEDQTSKETQKETSKETAVGKETQQGTTQEKTSEPDYKVKFQESQSEALRLLQVLKSQGIDPKTGKKTEEDNPEKETSEEDLESEKEAKSIDEIVEKKVRERVKPLILEQENQAVDSWLKSHPQAYDHVAEIEELYEKMPGATISDKLENALAIALRKKVVASEKEKAANLYNKEQAATGGGVSSAPSGEGLPQLDEDERKVAQKMGISEEAYAKRKLEKK